MLASENERLVGLKSQGVFVSDLQIQKFDQEIQSQVQEFVQQKTSHYEEKCLKFEKQIKEIQEYYESKIEMLKSQ